MRFHTFNDDEDCGKQSSHDWDLADYRREDPHIQNHRSVSLGSREDVPTPQKGQVNPLDHSHLGLVGWNTYWSLGNCTLVVKIIVGLICKLNLTESVLEALTPVRSNDTRGRDKLTNSHVHEGWSC